MPKTEHCGGYELNPDQQQIVDDGLRNLARMIVRRFHQDAASARQQDTERPEGD